jgi:hypothetical protein
MLALEDSLDLPEFVDAQCERVIEHMELPLPPEAGLALCLLQEFIRVLPIKRMELRVPVLFAVVMEEPVGEVAVRNLLVVTAQAFTPE